MNPTTQPWTRLGLRPSMLLAAADEDGARRLIDRGVAADGTLGRVFGRTVQALFVRTDDAARNVRAPLFPPHGTLRAFGTVVKVLDERDVRKLDWAQVVIYETGLAQLTGLDHLGFVPGALADHLTSFGGVLDGSGRQSTVLDWIAAGATASYGTVSEPCNLPQKFPHPEALLANYLQGSTALEAYWRSVRWPAQGLFVGEPLASPYAARR